MNRHLSESNVSVINFVCQRRSSSCKLQRAVYQQEGNKANILFFIVDRPKFMIWNKLKTHLQYNYGQHCWILRWICCFNEWKQTWTLKRRNWNKLRMTSVLGSLHPTGDAADFLVQPWMTYWQQYWPLTLCSHEASSVSSGSDLMSKWTASVHTGPVFLWAVCLHWTFLPLSAFGGSGGNKNRSSTTSHCLHVQKGRVLNRSPVYLYKTVYKLLLLSFFSFWD